jgi:hypothetical protein
LNAREVRNRQRGGGTIKFILTVLILGFVVFAMFKVAPAYFANYQLEDMMKSEALFATSAIPHKTSDDIRADLWKKVQELGIPATQEQIKVTTNGDNQGSAVTMAVDYTVPVDLVVYKFTLDFHSHAESHSL